MEIKIERAKTLKEKPGADQELGFGKFYTDHMFVMDWDIGQGWHDARIVPFGPIQMDPASMVLHYAQETFEGLKAYRTKDDRILLFRPEMNARRFANSNKRLCMPEVSEEDFVEAVTRLVDYEKLRFTSVRSCSQPKRQSAYTLPAHINLSSSFLR